jgi:flagellar biosynthesis GTPase FlhF
MGTVAVIVVVVAVVAAIAWGLLRLRTRRDGVDAIAARRPAKGRRRRLGQREDPMAAVVASHSQAVEPHDAAVEELRLRAQANRVAAAKHQREADALAPSATEEARQQARAHQEAAAQHQRTADELEQRTPPAF